MKTILMALLAISITFFNAQARPARHKDYCGVQHKQVCKGSRTNGYHCYNTKYAENFKVCKNDNGYFICCETPNYRNSTRSYTSLNTQNYQPNRIVRTEPAVAVQQDQTADDITVMNSNSYQGYYTGKGRIKVCYSGDNVAELNRAPYHGCPSPAFDGPATNNYRNVNVSTPNVNAPLAPIEGRRQ
jgi:hypothetical protein